VQLGLDHAGIVAAPFVQGGVELGMVQPVMTGGAMGADLLREGNDGLAGGEESDGFQLDRG
jgi:hypothetical protein